MPPLTELVRLPQDITLMFREMTLTEEFEKSGYPEAVQQRWIDYFELNDLLDRHPFDLSGGEQQRAALAIVMLSDPDILLLDEPTKSIDAETKLRLGACLRDLARQGKAILLTSHDLDFTATYADTCCMMFDRHILGYAPIGEFFRENLFYTTVADLMSRGLSCHRIAANDLIDTVRARLAAGCQGGHGA